MPGRPGPAAVSVTPARGGREPSHGQDPADRSRADAIAEAEEFAPDAAVSPARILPGQPPDQFTDLLRDRRASGGVRVGPFLLYQAPVPDKQGARHHDPLYPKVPGQQPRQGGYHRPVSPVWFRAGDLAAQHRDLMPDRRGESAPVPRVKPRADALHEFWHATRAARCISAVADLALRAIGRAGLLCPESRRGRTPRWPDRPLRGLV